MTGPPAKVCLGLAGHVMILPTLTNGTFRQLSVECREFVKRGSQHLAVDGARMQQPIGKNALQQ